MSAFRKQSKSLDHFNVQDFKPFKPQRVVSFKLYAQEQKSRLTTLYPFLTQEQICLKIKDKWNRMENELKQNYTKAVLSATPSKKTEFSKLPSQSPGEPFKTGNSKNNSDSEDAGLHPAVTSKSKVADWLNDPKQKQLTDKRKKGKTYDTTRYTLSYDVPTVIDPTPTKQPGILKTCSSEKKENQKKKLQRSRRQSRVSFSPNSEAQGKKEMDSQKKKVTKSPEKNGKTRTRLESKFTNLNEAFNFDDMTPSGVMTDLNVTKMQDAEKTKPIREQPNKRTRQSNLKELVFEENIEEELFTTPEMAKLPLQEISKAPKKRKSAGIPKDKKLIPPKAKQVKNMNESGTEVLNTNNNSNIVTDVFGKKAWAASTYSKKVGSRKMTPEKSESGKKRNAKLKKKQEESYIQEEKGSLTGPFQNSSDDDDRADFFRNKRGLLVGPIGCEFDKDMDDQPVVSDESENELKMDDGCEVYAKEKEIGFEDTPEKDIPCPTRRLSRTKKKGSEKKTGTTLCKNQTRASYTSDFDEMSHPHSQDNLKKTVKQKNRVKKKSLDEVVESLMEKTPKNKNVKRVSPHKPRLVSLCKDFAVEKPVSPIISDAGDSNMSSNVTEETSSPAAKTSGGNPALMKVLLKMRQITSPNIIDFVEGSPKLLSPTLSGITELSSLSTESSATKDNENSFGHSMLRKSRTQSSCNVKEPLEGEVFPVASKSSRHSTRLARQSEAENILCRMFQDMTPPETEHKSQRRLVSSNKTQRRSNFDNMFEEQDIFI